MKTKKSKTKKQGLIIRCGRCGVIIIRSRKDAIALDRNPHVCANLLN